MPQFQQLVHEYFPIIISSPGMPAFIHEIFLFPHKEGIDLNRLKVLAHGHGNKIMQNAVCPKEKQKPRRKVGFSLDFNSFGQFCYLPFTNFDQLSAESTLNIIHFDFTH